ncbi:hypothetical protein GQ53DRAFT_155180 [Thozetella sp. PMI_491]|nr:hypothetical protein GQ53DRAFT_155180 [Thozetella sp. PMI_491]
MTGRNAKPRSMCVILWCRLRGPAHRQLAYASPSIRVFVCFLFAVAGGLKSRCPPDAGQPRPRPGPDRIVTLRLFLVASRLARAGGAPRHQADQGPSSDSSGWVMACCCRFTLAPTAERSCAADYMQYFFLYIQYCLYRSK